MKLLSSLMVARLTLATELADKFIRFVLRTLSSLISVAGLLFIVYAVAVSEADLFILFYFIAVVYHIEYQLKYNSLYMVIRQL